MPPPGNVVIIIRWGRREGSYQTVRVSSKPFMTKAKSGSSKKKMGFSGKLCQENTDETDTFTFIKSNVEFVLFW